ncbi:alpha/beta hydrolase [Ramlibacter sp.]|uniref:alpha/beta hydrolase n=1 Tax=Ramlibacter sp. TaxID=1917967 RepID=UPI002FC9584F
MEIHTVVTADGVTLQVAWIAPRDPNRPVVLATHGVGNSFTLSALWQALRLLAADGWGVAMLNNRGHDWVAMNAGDRRWIGAAHERIEDSVLDFQAAQRWLRERGHRRIVMGGHSLGGLKACYTQAHHPVDDVVALAMFSSPRLPDDKVWDWAAHQQLMARCADMVAQGRGDELMHVDMPTNTPAMKGLMSPATYINKYGPNAATTALRYADRIRVPTFLLAGDHEKPQLSFSIDMEAALVNAPSVRRVVIEDCDHVYTNRLEQVASATDDWLRELSP